MVPAKNKNVQEKVSKLAILLVLLLDLKKQGPWAHIE